MSDRSLTLVAIAGLAGVGAVAAAQSDSVEVDLSGVELRSPFNDVSRNSQSSPAPGSDTLINLAEGYSYDLQGQIDVDIFGLNFIPSGPGSADLGELVNLISPGQSRLLNGFARNPGGIPPEGKAVWFERFEGDFNGITISITLEFAVGGTGVVSVNVRDIDIPALARPFFTIDFVSGSATLSVWEPSEPQLSEWHFDGDLLADERSAGSDLRYLDDEAFGPILGGLNDPESFPPTPTPHGVTEAQSAFVDSDVEPGLGNPGGVPDTVYLASPSFNQTDPASSALRRGIGLSLFPELMPEYPGAFVGSYTFVWDLNIPSSSWFNANGTTPRGLLLSLIQDDSNNDMGADLWIRNDGGQPSIVFTINGNDFTAGRLNLPASVAPDTWFRLAVAVDEFQSGTSQVYVNGAYVGDIRANWVNNSVDPTAPAYTDGVAVDPLDWEDWGMHPSPWSTSDGDPPAYLRSSINLFADLRFGQSYPVYLANLAFVDRVVPGDEIAGLGGPSGDGIFLLKSELDPGCNAADLAAPFDALDIADVVAFLQFFGAMDENADLAAPMGAFDIADVVAFLQVFGAGCPS